MTSMPASRSARAMIFAPRSCPSRPGFATTTLILPAMPGSVFATRGHAGHVPRPDRGTWLEDRRLAPDAPDLAEGVAHLAHRHVGAGSVDDRAHQVAVVAGGVLLQPGERRFDRRGVALRLERLHAVDLLLLEGRVDLEDLD